MQSYIIGTEAYRAETLDDYNTENAMLKTIHVPKNLTQLSDLLPAPKYGDPVPKQTFERSRSTQKVIERVGSRERKTIVEMAQAIKLPPIKEQELSDL